MAELINLKRARKARDRDRKERDAEANRLAFGRTKDARALAEHERAKAAKEQSGRKLDK